MIQQFLIFATRASRSYAKKVVAAITKNPEKILFPEKFDYTDQLSVEKFADGELEVTLHNSVRGKIVFLFACSARNDENISNDECKIELYHTIDVLRRSQAKEIIVFEPFVSCSRSDRKTRRNSVGMWVHYKTLISLGTNHLITYQLHSDKSKTIFDPCICAVDDVPATILLQKFLCENIIKNNEEFENNIQKNWLFCSVDAGGEKLAKKFAGAFNTQLVVAHKQRSTTQHNTIESINILSAVSLKEKCVWIIDDMIDTGASIYGLVQELATKECTEINIMIVHPVFSHPAIEKLNALKENKMLNRLVVCDTIDCSILKKTIPFIEIIESADFSSKIIITISLERPMSPLTDDFSPHTHLEKISR